MAEIKYKAGFRPKMSIKRKLILSFSIAVLVPLFILAVANTLLFRAQTKKTALEKVRLTLSGAERIYFSQGNMLKNAFLSETYNPFAVKAVINNNTVFLNSILHSYQMAFTFADYIGITGKNGNIIASTSGVAGEKPSLGGIIHHVFVMGSPLIKTASLKTYILQKLGMQAMTSSESGMFMVTAVPFFKDGKTVGTIFGLINLNDNQYLPRTIYNEYRLRTAVFTSLFSSQVCITTLNLPGNIFGVGSRLPAEIHNNIMMGRDFIKEINYGGNDIFAAFHPIKDVNGNVIGSLGVFISNREYIDIFWKTAAYAIAVIIVGLIISFIISFIASKDTLNPIYATISAIKSFAGGDLNTKLIINTNDEFDDIGNGFTDMVATIKDREERMENYNVFSDFLVGSLNFDKIISSTLDILEELLNLSSGIIYVYESEGVENFLIPWKFYGIRKFVANKLNATDGIAGHCLTTRKTVWFHDIPENSVVLKDKLLENGGNGKAIDYGFCEVFPKDIVWLPLYVGEINIGVLTVSSLFGFDKEDVSFLEHAAKELSVSLDNARVHKRLNELSITDELTHLYNRRKLDEVLELEFNKAVRYKNPLSILMLDIDHFKNVNDVYGHKTGDIVLSKLGEMLKERTRNVDLTARYGGEEFMVILPLTDFNSAVEAAKKLKNAVKEHEFEGLKNGISVSIGIASLPDENISNVDDMLKIADDFLYEAKEAGRNRIIGVHDGKRVEVN